MIKIHLKNIVSNFIKSDEKYYLFFDEIQNVEVIYKNIDMQTF